MPKGRRRLYACHNICPYTTTARSVLNYHLLIMLNLRPKVTLALHHVAKRFLQPEGVRVPGVHEPQYLADLKPKVGYYERLNLSLTGYDFVVLEKYQSYVNKKMNQMKIEVINAWSVPCKELQFDILADRSTAIESTYKIKIYQRNIGMKDALVTKLPLLIDLLHSTSPPGVTFSIDRHTPADEERLYFKNSALDKLKEELQELKDTPLIGV